LGSVSDREAGEEPGDVCGERPLRLLDREPTEVADLALDRLGQLDDRSIAPGDFT
jgi:hypothetical protein